MDSFSPPRLLRGRHVQSIFGSVGPRRRLVRSAARGLIAASRDEILDCGDGVLCTVDSCNEATNSCNNTPSNAACDNGQYCDGSETCSAVNGCQAGTPVNCSDIKSIFLLFELYAADSLIISAILSSVNLPRSIYSAVSDDPHNFSP